MKSKPIYEKEKSQFNSKCDLTIFIYFDHFFKKIFWNGQNIKRYIFTNGGPVGPQKVLGNERMEFPFLKYLFVTFGICDLPELRGC